MTDPAVDVTSFKAFEATGWEQQANGYDRFWSAITGRAIPALLDAAAVGRGHRVLDVATGPGLVAGQAAVRGASVVGVDVAAAMVALAQSRHPGLEFRCADANELPFPDGSFDAVVGNFIVPHLGAPEEAVEEFCRVLAPGGRLALTTWDAPARARLFGLVLDALAAAGASPPPDIPAGPSFFRFADDGEFRSLLIGAGLAGVEVTTIAFTHRFPDATTVWEGIVTGTVRTAALILRQPEGLQADIRRHFEHLANRHSKGGAVEIPISVKVASGSR